MALNTSENHKKQNKSFVLSSLYSLLTFSIVAWTILTSCPNVLANDSEKLFDYKKIELDNGLDVITLEDFSCPIVAVQLWYHVGSKDEYPNRQGFAHMFEHMMFRGTDRLGPTDHFGLIRKVGGTTNGYTSFDRTVYLETLPADQIELAMWLEAERMAFLKIDQEAFDTERKVVEEERRRGLSRPYGTYYENLMPELFKVHPYRWLPIGNIAHLRASSVNELRNFWKKYYVPSNATLVIVGAVKHEHAQSLAKKYFGWIPLYDQPNRVTVAEPGFYNGPKTVTIKEDNAPAPQVELVYHTVPANNQDTAALDILASILGTGQSSRLYRELVAQKQLAVSADASHWSLEQDGLFSTTAVMSPKSSDANEIISIMEKHIDAVRKKFVSGKELAKAKNQMLRYIVTDNLRIDRKARVLGLYATDIGDVSLVNEQLESIKNVTRQDIRRVAREYLMPEKCFRVKVIQNVSGQISEKKHLEENAPITAEPEISSPKPGRGAQRPTDYPKTPPLKKIASDKLMPKYHTRILDNNLKVMVVPNHEVPFVSFTLGMKSGAWTEQKPGTCSMALSMLTKGTENFTEAQLADELETYAITLGGSGGMDTSSVSGSCLTEHTIKAMTLLEEIVLRPTFPEDEFAKLTKQVLTSLTVSSQEPSYIAEKNYRKAMYGSHPYARTATGEIEDVNALNVDDIKLWWKKHSRPDNAVLIIAGDIEPEKAFSLAEKTFAKWKASDRLSLIKPGKIEKPESTHIYLVDKPGSVQSQIRIGQPAITRHDEGYFVSRVVSGYFGWGFDSRLNKSVRVEKGLTYAVWGSYIAKRFAGDFTVGTFSKTESTAQVINAVIEEIKKLKNKKPNNTELKNNINYILGSFVRQRETPQQVAGDLWLIESQQLGNDYLQRLLYGIANTDANDCEKLVSNTIEPDKLVIVVVGQAQKIKNDLEKIAPVTVIPNKSGP